jgi:hypothetical protein
VGRARDLVVEAGYIAGVKCGALERGQRTLRMELLQMGVYLDGGHRSIMRLGHPPNIGVTP